MNTKPLIETELSAIKARMQEIQKERDTFIAGKTEQPSILTATEVLALRNPVWISYDGSEILSCLKKFIYCC